MHPFYIVGSGWVEAQYLKLGDPLYRGDKGSLSIGKIAYEQRTETVYNFSVVNTNTYFVGVDKVLVHNCSQRYKEGVHGDTRLPKNDGKDSHHMSSKQSNPSVHPDEGAAIQMDPKDHQGTASYGGREGSALQAYRNKQAELIRDGKLDDAFLMDVDDIQSKFGDKYDDAILEAIDKLP